MHFLRGLSGCLISLIFLLQTIDHILKGLKGRIKLNHLLRKEFSIWKHFLKTVQVSIARYFNKREVRLLSTLIDDIFTFNCYLKDKSMTSQREKFYFTITIFTTLKSFLQNFYSLIRISNFMFLCSTYIYDSILTSIDLFPLLVVLFFNL